jgi:hypothetical protein
VNEVAIAIEHLAYVQALRLAFEIEGRVEETEHKAERIAGLYQETAALIDTVARAINPSLPPLATADPEATES